MFLKSLLGRNPDFISAAVTLHQEGRIPANSYVLDLDAIETNSRLLTRQAHATGLKVFAMTKQIGRVRPALDAIARGGVDGFVAVDMGCARPIVRAGHRLGHLGHLVQIAQAENDEAASLRPEYWTVFNDVKAEAASASARRTDTEQRLLTRIYGPDDIFYEGHEGGFPADQILAVADRIDALDRVDFAGITTFPAALFDQATGTVVTTPNLATMARAAEALARAGRTNIEINAPGTTSTAVLQTLVDAGATQVEPGHGLTGTTPLHVVEDLPELPAALYLTEVSHLHGGRAYCFGGGLYIDPIFDPYQVTALVGSSADEVLNSTPTPAFLPPPSSIDYYGQLLPPAQRNPNIGDTVIFGFRIQAFFTRAFVAPVTGIASGHPQVQGIWMPDGIETGWGRNS